MLHVKFHLDLNLPKALPVCNRQMRIASSVESLKI